jgi:hypothetical protein
VDVARQRRPLVRACLDWSEGEPHLAGALGAAITARLFELGWIERLDSSRSVAVTAKGGKLLRAEMGFPSRATRPPSATTACAGRPLDAEHRYQESDDLTMVRHAVRVRARRRGPSRHREARSDGPLTRSAQRKRLALHVGHAAAAVECSFAESRTGLCIDARGCLGLPIPEREEDSPMKNGLRGGCYLRGSA